MSPHVTPRPRFLAGSLCRHFWVLLVLTFAVSSQAGELRLAWDPVGQAPGYRLHYGETSGRYTKVVPVGNTSSYRLTGLQEGRQYCVAATAYDATRAVESGFSNEVCATIPGVTTAPTAAFSGKPTSGTAPLTVTFTDSSKGQITDRCWDFIVEDGTDCVAGGSGTGAQSIHTYSTPGTYTARMTVRGPGGSDAAEVSVAVTAKPPTAPTASFSVDPMSGMAPLAVTFTDTSSGEITKYQWDFGDGSSDTRQNPIHTFTDAGRYTVALTVSGSGGSNTITKSVSVGAPSSDGRLLEAREVAIDTAWRRIVFTEPFSDPIVVATALSTNDPDPALVRIRNVDSSGFEIRIQEWDHQDGVHGTETIGILAVERGSHILPNGARLEAGRFSTDSTESFSPVSFDQVFAMTPIVLSSVTTFNGGDAVVTRHSGVTTKRFELQLQEQEANELFHVPENVDYVAVGPSSGTIDGLAYEAARTPTSVDDRPYWIDFQQLFSTKPVLLANMQSTNGPDTANLRHSFLGPTGTTVNVAEEQSRDDEVDHVSESVGYLALEAIEPDEPVEPVEPTQPIQPEGLAGFYNEAFSAYADGAQPVNWIDTAANNSMKQDNSLFRVINLGGEKVFGTSSSATNIHSHFIGPALDGLSAYDYTGRMRMTNTSGGMGVTFFSNYPQSDAYYRLRSYRGGSFQLANHPHGKRPLTGDSDTGVVPERNRWYRYFIRVEDTGSSTAIRAKVWAEGQREPTSWQIEASDNSGSRLKSGTIGLWSMGSGSKYWDDLTATGP